MSQKIKFGTLYKVVLGVPCGISTDDGSNGGSFSNVILVCGRWINFGQEADLLDSGAVLDADCNIGLYDAEKHT